MLPKNRRTTTRFLTIYKCVLKPTIAIDTTYFIVKSYGNDMCQWINAIEVSRLGGMKLEGFSFLIEKI